MTVAATAPPGPLNVKLEDEDIFADAFTTIDGISSVVHMRVAQKNGS